ncbi:MAG: hypothetical protein HY430_01425 [Candidatus Levybacteria bacterium]|nr:hypothetical protein [Candidatus Levybacteria bacterium]
MTAIEGRTILAETIDPESVGKIIPEKIDISVPQVIYHKDILQSETPYTISVNPEACADLFRVDGITDNQIRQIKINIRRKTRSPIRIPGFAIGGMYKVDNNEITLYTDWLWRMYKRRSKKVAKHLKNRDSMPVEKEQKNWKRLLGDLPSSANLEEIDQGINKKAGRILRSVLIREAKHYIDFNNPEYRKKAQAMLAAKAALIYGVGIGTTLASGLVAGICAGVGTMGVEYLVDPLERRARKFTKQMRNDERFTALVEFAPKESMLLQSLSPSPSSPQPVTNG